MKPLPRFISHRCAAIGLAGTLVCLSSLHAQITVTTLADENDSPAGAQISLREALRDVSNPGVITFDPALSGKVLVLSEGQLVIAGKNVSVSASGGFVIDARRRSRLFQVESGASLTLSGLTLQSGLAPGEGGAILSAGSLSLADCVLRDNHASDGSPGTRGADAPHATADAEPGSPGGPGYNGGAIACTGSLTAQRCHFTGNAAGTGGMGGRGGNGFIQPPFTPYSGAGGVGGAGGAGGAIWSSGALNLAECIFESNVSGRGGDGGFPGTPSDGRGALGGIAGSGAALFHTGSMTIDRCTFTGNKCSLAGYGELRPPSAPGSGHAIFWQTGTATLTNCTLSGNGASEYLFAMPFTENGAALASGPGTMLRLVHCTVTGNRSGTGTVSAGIAGTAPVECLNCIVSGNLLDRHTSGTTPVWEEVNFSSTTQRTLIPSGSLGSTTGVEAKLGPLSITSGNLPLPVLIPLTDSPARNTGAVLASPPVTDQRGLPRTVGTPDQGAVEVQETESTSLAAQSIAFSPPLYAPAASLTLAATSSSGLPVSFSLLSGPATVDGNTLTFTGADFAIVLASQPGNETTAPARSVTRVIGPPHSIPFTPELKYLFIDPGPVSVTLPVTTSAGKPVAWSLADPSVPGITLSGNVVTATAPGTVAAIGTWGGDPLFAPIHYAFTLRFLPPAVWWEPPSLPPPPPLTGLKFTLVEGSPYGLNFTVRMDVASSTSTPVPALPAGLVATPSVIPAGQTSLTCMLTLSSISGSTNKVVNMPTGPPGTPNAATAKLFLVKKSTAGLLTFSPPPRVVAGAAVPLAVSSPGVTVSGSGSGPPPPDIGQRTLTVTAWDFDTPSIIIPVSIASQESSGTGTYTGINLQLVFPPVNRRARLTVTSDDGISETSSFPIQIFADTNADGDGVNDIIEAALQHAPDQIHEPPLAMVCDAAGTHVVLAARPLNNPDWSLVIQQSTDLQTWTPVPLGTMIVTPNPDNTTERVSALLPPAGGPYFVRLAATLQ